MSNEQEQVVGIEEALAEAYATYVKFADEQVRKAFHDLDLVEWVHTSIKPQPEWTQWKSDDLTHLYHLIKNADMKTAEEAVAKNARAGLISFKSFVETLVDACKDYGDVQEGAQS